MEQSARPKKTDIVRKRTGCQNCKSRRRKCDETRPECSACVRRGIQCSGYDRPIAFKDVTALAAESSKKFEAARWSALHLEDARRKRRRTAPPIESSQARLDAVVGPSVNPQAQASALPVSAPAPPPPWHGITADGFPGGAFALPWALFDTAGESDVGLLQHRAADVIEVAGGDIGSTPLHQHERHTESPKESSPDAGTPTAWDEFLESEDSPLESTPSEDSLLGEPTTDLRLSLPLEESLVQHFDTNVVPAIPVTLAFSDLFKQSSCFRAAVLALSASHLRLAERLPLDFESLRRVCDDKSMWVYYDTAVKDLQMQLQRVGKRGGEDLAGAALLLAYHEIEAGTGLGIRNHASGLDAIASKLDFAASSVPDLFKAWRLLRYDARFLKTPTRWTTTQVDSYDVSSFLDPQLAIRDIFSRSQGLYARHAMEASFNADASIEGSSSSEKAARWICSVLGRVCDHHNFQMGDFFKDNLTPGAILQQCDVFSRRLDCWHKGLCDHDLPIARLGTGEDLVSGPTFETVVTYKFSAERKALDYIMYLISRMTVTYLRSVFDPSLTAAVSDTWAKIILGIVCGMNIHQRQQFTVFRIDIMLLLASRLCESVNFATTVLDYLLPKIMRAGLTAPEMVAWVYLKSELELWVREKMRGRAVRFSIASVEEDAEPWQLLGAHQTALFGDLNGKGYFRDRFLMECFP
ncbi:Beauvericin cluster-specific repressor BEA4 [Colletotrichum trifolii]|uniref:Beauvericin cluster-specific repressor BEA4 n=1 Tax=Colletotrichum trifolii TaxID=5466 RepID=A0A4V3HXK7_COLTR|nr:Beauvericin cluster-specific repressor BEA4 [Colletotrichum trifolii]